MLSETLKKNKQTPRKNSVSSAVVLKCHKSFSDGRNIGKENVGRGWKRTTATSMEVGYSPVCMLHAGVPGFDTFEYLLFLLQTCCLSVLPFSQLSRDN